MDREKVVQALDDSLKNQHCGFVDGVGDVYAVSEETIRNVISLLKEQEAVKRTYRTGINGFSIIWTCGACGSDLYPNNAKAKLCSNCGQAVKWEWD